MCHIDEENKSKVVDILKRDLKSAEQDTSQLIGVDGTINSSSDDDDNDNDDDDEKEAEGDGVIDVNDKEVDPDELIRAYETEAENWKPWWFGEGICGGKKLVHEVREDEENKENESSNGKLNERLRNKSTPINVANANSNLYNEILQTTYLYALITRVYQLREEDFNEMSQNVNELKLIEEICFGYLQAEKLLASNELVKKASDLKSRFNLVIVCLIQMDNYFLKVISN
jgi:hypothetical protein